MSRIADVYNKFQIELAKGEGSYVWDNNGKKYLDLYGGHAVISIGHNHEHYNKRIENQLKKLPFYSNAVLNHLQEALADKLVDVSGVGDYSLFLCNSGAEANENALKLASFTTGRSKVMSFKGGFHGRTSGAVSVTDNPKIISPFNAGHQVDIFDEGNEVGIEEAISTKEYAAVIIEPIQGIGGVKVYESEFLEKLDHWCDASQTILIADEVQCGYGRSGKFFAFQYSNIHPKLILLAKGMGNGFPIGGVLIHNSVVIRKGQLGSTFGGNQLACAAGLAVLEVIESENLINNALQMEFHIKQSLKDLQGIKEIRGKGLMIGMELDFPIVELRESLTFDHNIFTGNSANPNVFRLLPPLSVSKSELNEFISIFSHIWPEFLAKYGSQKMHTS